MNTWTFPEELENFGNYFANHVFDYPINDISLFVPPLFSEVRKKLTEEIVEYIDQLNISNTEKQELKEHYNKVWSLVTSTKFGV